MLPKTNVIVELKNQSLKKKVKQMENQKKRGRNRRPKRKPNLNLPQLLKLIFELPVDQRLSLRNQLTRNLESHV